MIQAAGHDYSDIIDLLLLQPHVIYLEVVLYIACLGNSIETVRILLPHIDSKMKWKMNIEHLSMSDKMIAMGIPWLDVFLSMVCARGYEEIAMMLINAGAKECICGLDINIHPYTPQKSHIKGTKRRILDQ
jgi:hypothetical protein